MAIVKKYDALSASRRISEAVSSIDVVLDVEPRRQLSAKGIRTVTPFHDVNDEGYEASSLLERKLEEVFGKDGANDNDRVCTVEFQGYQMLMYEHAGHYSTSNWMVELSSGQLRDVRSLVGEDFDYNFSMSMYGSRVDAVHPVWGTDYCIVDWSSNESELGLGFVPSETAVLTDREGRKLAFDREVREGLHVFLLDGSVFFKESASQDCLEFPRESAVYDGILEAMNPSLRKSLAENYVREHTIDLSCPDGPDRKYSGSRRVLRSLVLLNDVSSGLVASSDTDRSVLDSLKLLPLVHKEDLLFGGLRMGALSFGELRSFEETARQARQHMEKSFRSFPEKTKGVKL